MVFSLNFSPSHTPPSLSLAARDGAKASRPVTKEDDDDDVPLLLLLRGHPKGLLLATAEVHAPKNSRAELFSERCGEREREERGERESGVLKKDFCKWRAGGWS